MRRGRRAALVLSVLGIGLIAALLITRRAIESFAAENVSRDYDLLAQSVFSSLVEFALPSYAVSINAPCKTEKCIAVYIVKRAAVRSGAYFSHDYIAANAVYDGGQAVVYDEDFFIEQVSTFLTDYQSLHNMQAIATDGGMAEDAKSVAIGNNRIIHLVLRANYMSTMRGRNALIQSHYDFARTLSSLQSGEGDRSTDLLTLSMSFVFFHELGHYKFAQPKVGFGAKLARLFDATPPAQRYRLEEQFADEFASENFRRLFIARVESGYPGLYVFDAAATPVRNFLFLHRYRAFDGFRGLSYADQFYDTYSRPCPEFSTGGTRSNDQLSTFNNIDFVEASLETVLPLLSSSEFAEAAEKAQTAQGSTHAHPANRGHKLLMLLDELRSHARIESIGSLLDRDLALVSALLEKDPKSAKAGLESHLADGSADRLRDISRVLIRLNDKSNIQYSKLDVTTEEGVNCSYSDCRVSTVSADGVPFIHIEELRDNAGAIAYRIFFEMTPMNKNVFTNSVDLAIVGERRTAVAALVAAITGGDVTSALFHLSSQVQERQACGGASAISRLDSGAMVLLTSTFKPDWFKMTVLSAMPAH